MENQHRKITGYRELGQHEVDLMNEIKALGPQIEAVVLKVQEHLNQQRAQAALESDETTASRMGDATPERFANLGITSMQTGLMYLTRAVAQPTSF